MCSHPTKLEESCTSITTGRTKVKFSSSLFKRFINVKQSDSTIIQGSTISLIANTPTQIASISNIITPRGPVRSSQHALILKEMNREKLSTLYELEFFGKGNWINSLQNLRRIQGLRLCRRITHEYCREKKKVKSVARLKYALISSKRNDQREIKGTHG